ncbi:Ldh family oxidoreductase [Agrococcus terreus]|uniref:Lactate dehydrogenase n=1 Tax=Agrococcus terreus TaxID=574649 RepID=A0ABQ2KLM7_9MICO|nr:Ldh family oxidoreductase [Agrococcus terreus]GGN84973.1 lactate dehydrogenase [Agrococcus terreus]
MGVDTSIATELIELRGLLQGATDIAERAGMPRRDAQLLADTLLQAELWGHRSHGLLRLPWYIARIESGAMQARTEPETLLDTGPLMLMDGKRGVGQVLAQQATQQAVHRAKSFGVGVVGVRDSNHFGTAMYFTRQAAAEGCVSILTTNASPAMAPWGGRTKGIGTNPWSIAAPYGDRVVVLDIANTAVARGKIYLARERGEQIPDGWAMTADGAATTDPSAAIDGVILPMAGHKGYAISFMMDVLSGALTGSHVGNRVGGPYEAGRVSGAGHLVIAIDAATMDVDGTYAGLIEELVAQVHGTPLAVGSDEVVYPGELEDRAEAAARAAGGIALPDKTIKDLHDLAASYGVSLGF